MSCRWPWPSEVEKVLVPLSFLPVHSRWLDQSRFAHSSGPAAQTKAVLFLRDPDPFTPNWNLHVLLIASPIEKASMQFPLAVIWRPTVPGSPHDGKEALASSLAVTVCSTQHPSQFSLASALWFNERLIIPEIQILAHFKNCFKQPWVPITTRFTLKI